MVLFQTSYSSTDPLLKIREFLPEGFKKSFAILPFQTLEQFQEELSFHLNTFIYSV